MTTIGDGFNGVNPAGTPPPKDPGTVLRNYMKEHNCDEATAKAALEQMYGKPSQPMNSTFVPDSTNISQAALRGRSLFDPKFGGGINPSQLNENLRFYGMYPQIGLPDKPQRDDSKEQMLMDLGIPYDVIMLGDEAIREYAKIYEIDLPPKEKR